MGALRERMRRARVSVSEFWQKIKPGPEARRGALIALWLLVLPYWAYFGGLQRVGLGPIWDRVSWFLAACILLPLGAALVWLILTLLRGLPRFTFGVLLAAAVMIGIPWPTPLIGLVLALLAAGLGASLSSLLTKWPEMVRSRKVVTWALFALSVVGIASVLTFLAWDGTHDGEVTAMPPPLPNDQLLRAPNPADPGPNKVQYLTYGAGTEWRRPEFGKNAKVKSRTVDGSLLLKDVEGWKGKVLKWYWGFDTSKMPLNARVWYPDGSGPFPLVLIVHGNHLSQESSDPGYEYLGKLFASRGMIFASIDENFINGGFPSGYGSKETAARGWLLLEHLKLWREWNAAKGHPFEGKADLDRIALMGHSRGGEAVATADEFNHLKHFPGDANQKFDYGFHIRSLIAIAPADGQFKPAGMPRKLHDVSYLTVQGSHDYDVSTFDGSKQFQRTTFSDGFPGFKAYLYIYRANHGQFNTVWDRWDFSPPGVWLLNLKPLLTGEEQRQIGKVYFSAFLEATLRGREEYLPLFEDPRRGARWLPKTIYVSRFADASFHPVCTFDEDYDVDTTTMPGGSLHGENLAVWREQRVHFRQGERDDNAVYLGWRKGENSSYTLDLPPDLKLTADSELVFSLSPAGEDPPEAKDKDKDKDKKAKDKKKEEKKDEKKKKEPIDFTVELINSDGTVTRLALSQLGPIFPPLDVRFVKWKQLPGLDYGKDAEPVLQRYTARVSPLLRSVRFRFDRSPEGVVIVDDIGFDQTRSSSGERIDLCFPRKYRFSAH
jgi:hypothetical protein